MSKNYGTLTIDDITNAMNYAADQITRLKCEDKHIIDYMCDDGNVCMTYKEEDYNRKWMRPGSISSVKPCSEYTYGDHEVGDKCYIKPTDSTSIEDNTLDRIYPYCLPPSVDGNSYCGWQKSDESEMLKMTSGTCVANNMKTCMKYSTYNNERILKNVDGTFTAKSTTRTVKSRPEDNKGQCEPATCDPDVDDNCLPTKCVATNCQSDTDCKDEEGSSLPGLTGTCQPTTIGGVGYCVVDESYDCGEEKTCGGYGKVDGGSCATYGRYDLANIEGGKYIDCWRKEMDNDAQPCDTKYTTGVCYGDGACPKTKVPEGISQAYLEWHNNAGQCSNTMALYCKNGKCNNGRCECQIDGDCPGSSTCGEDNMCTDGGQCVYGNFLLRETCEQPQCRSEATAKNDFVYNNNNTLPPWKYDKERGTCDISRSYCAYGYKPFGYAKNISDFEKGASKVLKLKFSSDSTQVYDGKKKVKGCETDLDCADYGDKKWKCTDDYTTFNQKSGKSCSGAGAQCASDNFGDTLMKGLIGETLYNSAKYGESCIWGGGMTERFSHREIDEKTKKMTQVIVDHIQHTATNNEMASIILSKSKIKSSHMITNDVVPGIDLFYTEYTNGTKGIGLSIDQVKNIIPDNVKTTPTGDEYLVITHDQKFDNPILTKLYFLLTIKII